MHTKLQYSGTEEKNPKYSEITIQRKILFKMAMLSLERPTDFLFLRILFKHAYKAWKHYVDHEVMTVYTTVTPAYRF